MLLINPDRFPPPGGPVSKWIASAGDGGMFTSDDGGVTWEVHTMPTGFWSWRITQIGATLITVDGGLANTLGAATSADGETWTARTTPAQADMYGWYGVANDGARVVAVGQSDPGGGNSTQGAMYSDDDGVTWTMGSLVGDQWQSVLWAPELSLWLAQATSGANAMASSANGSSFTLRATTDIQWGKGTGAWNGSKYRCVGNNNTGDVTTVLKSTNGTSYTTASAGVALTAAQWGPTIWDGAQWVAIGTDGTTESYILTSADGDTWTQEATTIPIVSDVLAFDGTEYMAIERDGTSGSEVYTSADLATWTNVGTLPGTGYYIEGVVNFTV